MRILSSLIVAGLLLPQIGFAETFQNARDIRLPINIAKPTMTFVTLDDRAFNAHEAARIINDLGYAVAFEPVNDDENLMPLAVFESYPRAANTSPPTTINMLRDGNSATVFQPATSDTITLRFHLPREVNASAIAYQMDSSQVKNVRVRQGTSYSSLQESFVGTPGGNRIELSGELARHFEVTITVTQGVPRIQELQLFQPRTRLLFRAIPRRTYTLLYGNPYIDERPTDNTLSQRDAIAATLGPVRAPKPTETGDHDGVNDGDNCPDVWNLNQADGDKDGVGDACDNCPVHPNADQAPAENSERGYVCSDKDGDGRLNIDDNCPAAKNPEQQDEDKDGTGNICDTEDNRFTAGKPWILWASMTMIILILAGIGAVILRRTRAE
jgi:hypothetical protein